VHFEKECQTLQKDGKAYLDAMRCKHFHSLRLPMRPLRALHLLHPSGHFIASSRDLYMNTAMSSAQLRLAETIDTFYGASDSTSEGAMPHTLRRSVEELDSGIGRETRACLTCNTPCRRLSLMPIANVYHLMLRTLLIARPSSIP